MASGCWSHRFADGDLDECAEVGHTKNSAVSSDVGG
jgi:hypothetical protein